MAYTKRNQFEHLADETELTAANSGGGFSDAFNTVGKSNATMTVDDAKSAHGSKSLRVTPTTTSGTANTQWSTDLASVGFTGYFWLDAASADHVLLRINDTAGARVGSLVRLANGTMRIIGASNGTRYTSSATIALQTWLRWELYWAKGTDSTNGAFEAAIFAGDSTTPIAGLSSGRIAGNAGTLNAGTLLAGKTYTSTQADQFWMDDVFYDAAATGLTGPADVSTNKIVTIDDGVGIADTGAQQVTNVGYSNNDPVGIVDVIAAVRAKLVQLADGVGITDATIIDRSTATTGTRADGVGIGDLLVQAASRPRSVGDAVGISDQLVVARNRVVTLTDNVGIDDVETIIITKSSEGFSLTYFDGEQEYTVGLEFFFRLEDQG